MPIHMESGPEIERRHYDHYSALAESGQLDWADKPQWELARKRFGKCQGCGNVISMREVVNGAHTVWTQDDLNAYPHACGPVTQD